MLLTVFRRCSPIGLFKYRTEIALVRKPGLFGYLQKTQFLIGQQLHHTGHSEFIDIIADADTRQCLQLIV